MSDSFPMIYRSALGQGGGPAYLRALGVWHDFEDLVERSVQRSQLVGWVTVVRENLAEPTRMSR